MRVSKWKGALEKDGSQYADRVRERISVGVVLHRIAVSFIVPSVSLNFIGLGCMLWTWGSTLPLHGWSPQSAQPVSAFSLASGHAHESFGQDQWTMDSWTSFPGPGFCGSWTTEYKELHARMRRGEIPRKFVTFKPINKGLGDLFNGIIASLIGGLVSNRSLILMDSILDVVVEPNEINWRMGSDVNTTIDTTLRQEIKESGTIFFLRRLNVPKWGGSMVEFPANTLEYFRLLDKAENVVVHANGGILSRIFIQKGQTYRALHKMGIRMPYALGCMLRFLFRTKPEVLQFLRKPMAELHEEPIRTGGSTLLSSSSSANRMFGSATPPPAVFPNKRRPAVCVHIRTEDGFAFSEGDKSKYIESIVAISDTILTCARRLSETWLPRGVEARWLFLSDSNQLVEIVKERHGSKIMRSPLVPKHVGDDMEKAVFSTYADWLLFSTCRLYVITESGFSKTSTAFNLDRPKRIIMPFRWFHDKVSNTLSTCSPAGPNSLLDFRDWSGL